MGSYLTTPVTKKESTDEDGTDLVCGASSMQGWRVSQEDAHNVIINFDENKSLFAVYDGHGGAEVALYTAEHLPQFIKNTQEFKDGNYRQALINAFMELDENLIKEEVLQFLEELKKEHEDDSYPNTDEDALDDEDDDGDNVSNLYEEATMPLCEVISRYKHPSLAKLKQAGELPQSPRLKSKDKKVSEAACSSSDGLDCKPGGSGMSGGSPAKSSNNADNVEPEEACSSSSAIDKKVDENCASSSETNVKASPSSSSDTKTEESASSSSSSTNGAAAKQNGEHHKEEEADAITSCDNQPVKGKLKDESLSNGDIEADASSTEENVKPLANGTRRSSPRKTKELGTEKLLENSLDDDSSESDEDFHVEEGNSSDESEDDLSSSRVFVEEVSSEEDEEDGEEGEDSTDEDEEGAAALRNRLKDALVDHREVPGMDSGCTAVVVLKVDNKIFVANAGDSRAVVSRGGTAKDLSEDHKPEDETERTRIEKAGGKVTQEGRVNGGLNLSRALGDHSYKQNASLPASEQMIVALPDVTELTLEPQDEFIVIACDGIWNSLSSQEVVDFVKENMQHKKLSVICEELFEKCLAPDTHGDGTGCDNMTCIIVKLSPPSATQTPASSDETAAPGLVKRSRDSEDTPESSKPPSKKPKTVESDKCSPGAAPADSSNEEKINISTTTTTTTCSASCDAEMKEPEVSSATNTSS